MATKFKNEKELQKELANRLKKHRDSINLEVPVGEKKWRIDILTEREIIECKPKLNRSTCFQATSQLELYQRYYPNRRLVVAAEEIDQSARDILKAKDIPFWSVRPEQRKVYSNKSSNAHKILSDKQKKAAQAERVIPVSRSKPKPIYERPIKSGAEARLELYFWAPVALIGAILLSLIFRTPSPVEINCYESAISSEIKAAVKPGAYVKVIEHSPYGRTMVSLSDGQTCWVDSGKVRD